MLSPAHHCVRCRRPHVLRDEPYEPPAPERRGRRATDATRRRILGTLYASRDPLGVPLAALGTACAPVLLALVREGQVEVLADERFRARQEGPPRED